MHELHQPYAFVAFVANERAWFVTACRNITLFTWSHHSDVMIRSLSVTSYWSLPTSTLLIGEAFSLWRPHSSRVLFMTSSILTCSHYDVTTTHAFSLWRHVLSSSYDDVIEFCFVMSIAEFSCNVEACAAGLQRHSRLKFRRNAAARASAIQLDCSVVRSWIAAGFAAWMQRCSPSRDLCGAASLPFDHDVCSQFLKWDPYILLRPMKYILYHFYFFGKAAVKSIIRLPDSIFSIFLNKVECAFGVSCDVILFL